MHLAIEFVVDGITVALAYRFSPVPAGTRLDVLCIHRDMTRFQRVLLALMRPLVGMMFRKQFGKLKKLIEAESPLGG